MTETNNETRQNFGKFLADLSRNMVILLRKELELAGTEFREKISASGKNAALLATGGVILFGGFLTALIAAVAGLALVLPLWAAALVVAVIVMVVGGGLISVSVKRLKKTDFTPTQAIESFRESRQWMKEILT